LIHGAATKMLCLMKKRMIFTFSHNELSALG
jgi:hypothetical protein